MNILSLQVLAGIIYKSMVITRRLHEAQVYQQKVSRQSRYAFLAQNLSMLHIFIFNAIFQHLRINASFDWKKRLIAQINGRDEKRRIRIKILQKVKNRQV